MSVRLKYLLNGVIVLAGLLPVATSEAQEDSRSEADFNQAREALVRRYISSGVFGRTAVRNEAVLRAMRTVPRHKFVPDSQSWAAYEDRPLPIGKRQTISQPYVVATMTEALRVEADDVVLEVGTGSGYQAAVLAEIVKTVYTIEIVPELGKRAEKLLQKLAYTNVHIRIGDGYKGWPEHAPFDAIIVTAAPDHIPQPLVDQLKPGGRLVIPVGPQGRTQKLMLIEKRADGSIQETTLDLVIFVPMTGEAEKKR